MNTRHYVLLDNLNLCSDYLLEKIPEDIIDLDIEHLTYQYLDLSRILNYLADLKFDECDARKIIELLIYDLAVIWVEPEEINFVVSYLQESLNLNTDLEKFGKIIETVYNILVEDKVLSDFKLNYPLYWLDKILLVVRS